MREIICLLALLVLFSCKKAEDRACLKGSGAWTVEERYLGPIEAIRLFDHIRYRLIQDSSDKVVLKAGENILPMVRTEMEDGVLSIQDDNRCNWLRDLPVNIQVDIHFSQLNSIYNESTSSLSTIGQIEQDVFVFDNYHSAGRNYLNIKTNHATIRLNAGGPLCEVRGESHHVNLRNSGGGKLLAKELVAHQVWADSKSDGEIELSIDGGTLWYFLDSYGSIYYRGEVGEFQEMSHLGSGQLIPID